MYPAGAVVIMRYVHGFLWVVGIIGCFMLYFNAWPIEGWEGWAMAAPLGLLMGYLIIFDLVPMAIFGTLNSIQERVGYEEKYDDSDDLTPKLRSHEKNE